MEAKVTPLSQQELKDLFAAQNSGQMGEIQKNQLRLRETIIQKYNEMWAESTNDISFKPIFDLDKKEAFDVNVTPELADLYNLSEHLKEFDKKSDASTAGIRAFVDILHSENPNMMYNDLFLTLLVEAEAEFLVQIHDEIRTNLEQIEKDDPGFTLHTKWLRETIDKETIEIVEDIYGLSLEKILPFVKDNIVKIISGEVRPHTAKFIEFESRILAEKGITVITTSDFSDSSTITVISLLTHLLGAAGSTYYSSSHSSNYMCGRKALGIGGAQLLPDKYEDYRRILRKIIEQKIYAEGGHSVTIAAANHKNIKKTLTYDRMTTLYRIALNVTPDDVNLINKATENGHKILLNPLNGSTWRTLKPLMEKLGVDKDVFDLIYPEEDQFFNVGYIIIKTGGSPGSEIYSVDHLGVDTTMKKIAETIPYSDLLKKYQTGIKIYECDPDSDRFVVKQVVDDTENNRRLITEYGIDYYILDNDKILVAPTPNKEFLLLDIADYERMKQNGTWDKYHSVYLTTYVSTRAWAEFANSVVGLENFMERVGFKNLSEMQQVIENWYFNKNSDNECEFTDQLGHKIILNKDKSIRIHAKSEESGGRVAGLNHDCYNIFGKNTLAMPEKSAADSLFSELTRSSELYLKENNFLGDYSYLNLIDQGFKKYDLKSKIDIRIDILHGDQGYIAQLPFKKQHEAFAECSDLKTNFNNFFFSISKAVRDGHIGLDKVKDILSMALPNYRSLWSRIRFTTLNEEPLSGGRTRPEGTPLIFGDENNLGPAIIELDFRPSGTDPLKSKVYIDAEKLSKEETTNLTEALSELPKYNLYDVLQLFGIHSIDDLTSQGLQRLKTIAINYNVYKELV